MKSIYSSMYTSKHSTLHIYPLIATYILLYQEIYILSLIEGNSKNKIYHYYAMF